MNSVIISYFPARLNNVGRHENLLVAGVEVVRIVSRRPISLTVILYVTLRTTHVPRTTHLDGGTAQ